MDGYYTKHCSSNNKNSLTINNPKVIDIFNKQSTKKSKIKYFKNFIFGFNRECSIFESILGDIKKFAMKYFKFIGPRFTSEILNFGTKLYECHN